MSIHIWIDADSCPRLVRHYVSEYALKHNHTLTFVANKPLPENERSFEMIICPQKKDAADDYILANSTENDMVITRDILLAERLVKKNTAVINDRGVLFTKDNIKDKVADRNFDFQLAQIGFGGQKKSTYNEKQLAQFISCFSAVISKLEKNHAFL